MSIRVKKTEHAGPKRGLGALWGRKKEAKVGSNRLRRERAKLESRQGAEEARSELATDAEARLKP